MPNSRRRSSTVSGLVRLRLAWCRAVSNRFAFFDERKRCAVSLRPATSSEGTKLSSQARERLKFFLSPRGICLNCTAFLNVVHALNQLPQQQRRHECQLGTYMSANSAHKSVCVTRGSLARRLLEDRRHRPLRICHHGHAAHAFNAHRLDVESSAELFGLPGRGVHIGDREIN